MGNESRTHLGKSSSSSISAPPFPHLPLTALLSLPPPPRLPRTAATTNAVQPLLHPTPKHTPTPKIPRFISDLIGKVWVVYTIVSINLQGDKSKCRVFMVEKHPISLDPIPPRPALLRPAPLRLAKPREASGGYVTPSQGCRAAHSQPPHLISLSNTTTDSPHITPISQDRYT